MGHRVYIQQSITDTNYSFSVSTAVVCELSLKRQRTVTDSVQSLQQSHASAHKHTSIQFNDHFPSVCFARYPAWQIFARPYVLPSKPSPLNKLDRSDITLLCWLYGQTLTSAIGGRGQYLTNVSLSVITVTIKFTSIFMKFGERYNNSDQRN